MALLPPSAFPLKTASNNIAAATGGNVRLCGVNWEGAHQDGRVAGGLDKLHRSEIINRIVGWGMNHVRLPFAVGTFSNRDGSPYNVPAPPGALGANPDLIGMTPRDVYYQLVEDMTAAGLYVILNKHLLTPGWCCSNVDNNGFWYNDNWPSSTFINTWAQLATRFAANPRVGYDIHNEPRDATISGVVRHPTWGDGHGLTDFRQMYQVIVNKIRAAGSSGLCFCEGLRYGGDLTGLTAHPVTGTGIVPSMHDYPWFHPSGQSQVEYTSQMDNAGGHLVTDVTAPIWIGEFGQDLASRAAMTTGWMRNFMVYAQERHLHWCWWSLSAQTVKGTEPVTNVVMAPDGNRQGFGLMCGQDWKGSNSEMITLLQRIM